MSQIAEAQREIRELKRRVQEEALIRRALLVEWRDRLLHQVDRIERKIGIKPRTAEIRKWWKTRED